MYQRVTGVGGENNKRSSINLRETRWQSALSSGMAAININRHRGATRGGEIIVAHRTT